jgi:hypothetical protein
MNEDNNEVEDIHSSQKLNFTNGILNTMFMVGGTF